MIVTIRLEWFPRQCHLLDLVQKLFAAAVHSRTGIFVWRIPACVFRTFSLAFVTSGYTVSSIVTSVEIIHSLSLSHA